MNLSVFAAAREAPERPAIVVDGRVITFAALAERVHGALARWPFACSKQDFERELPVAVEARAELDTLVDLYALFELGIPALLVHPRWTSAERARLVPDGLVQGWLDRAAATLDRSQAQPSLSSPSEERALAIVYSSGSSGAPKGIVLSRRAFLASARASRENLGWYDGDRWLLALPPAHVGGLSVITRCLIARRPIVLTQPLRDKNGVIPAALAEVVDREQVTLLSVVPTLLARLLELSPEWNPKPNVRAILVGGAPASPGLVARARRRGWPVLMTYGLTEMCSQVTTQRLSSPVLGDDDAGQPLPSLSVRVVDSVIEVRGPTLFSRYFPSGEAPCLHDGWFETGDLGQLDASGALHVTGRKSEVIITGGENVWPSDVETALLAFPDISEACAFGVPDPTWGEVVAAALVLREGAKLELTELAEFVRSALAPFKRPRRIALVSAITLTQSGKVDRTRTRADALAALQPL